MFDELFERHGVDVDFLYVVGVETQVWADVVEEFGGETVDFEELACGGEAAEAVAIADDAAGVGGADAVEELQGGGVGTVEFHYEGLARGRRWCGAVVGVDGVEGISGAAGLACVV